MVERVLLTPEVVDAARCPARGEIWLSDTIVQGFGLRLWRTGRSFCIRVTDRTGRTIRRSYKPKPWRIFVWNGEPKRFDGNGQLNLGLFVDLAREWAKLEIARAKGLAPSQEEQDRIDAQEIARREATRNRIGLLTLGHLADEFVEAGPVRGWSEEYTDRMRSLLHAHVPLALLKKELRQVRGEDYQELLTSPDFGDATSMALRHLIHQIHRWIHDEGGRAYAGVWGGLERLESKRPLSEAEAFARTVGVAELDLLFGALEKHSAFPAASLCLKTALVTQVPVARCMRAEWVNIVDFVWYPWLKDERTYWWSYRRAVRGKLAQILGEARKLWDQESPFLFPSPHTPHEHVRRVDHVWSGALKRLNWPYARVSTYAHQSSYLIWIDWEWPDLSKSAK